ncbi:MAG TPA: serine/threonine-protein kinase [Vicinamibacterales bacterium]|nr:serine/threonine-protein kinase [Vicinamibacterales bacterium]
MTTTIAHYNLLDRIGDGGIGELYRARDTKVGRTVALKLVSPAIVSDPERLRQLLEDARAAAGLSHPNIATLWDVGESDGHTYLAYEFAAGRSLLEESGGAPMNPRRALDLAVQIADGVADGHAHGILHGDLRPDTIIVTAKGSAKVLDFGLAPWTRGGALRAAAAKNPDSLPPESAAVLGYLSPEQAIGGDLDARTDVFSIGALTYEMVTGRNPFVAPTAAATVMNVIQGKFTPASAVNPAVSPELDAILARALTPDLDQRQQSAAALAAELRSVAAVLDVRAGDAASPSAIMPIDDAADRSGMGVLLSVLVAAAGAAAAVWWWLSR